MVDATQDALAAELAQLVRARHPSRLEELDLVLLGELAASRGRSITELVLTAIDEIPDGRTRQAARDLVPLPFTGRIAPTLTDRRTVAARSFGQSGNYFRSGPSDGSRPSTEALVLRSISSALPPVPDAGPGANGDDVGKDVEATRRSAPDPASHRPRWRAALDRGAAFVNPWAFGVAVAISAVAATLYSVLQLDDPSPEPDPPCRFELGSGGRYLRIEFQRALGAAGVGPVCPTGDVEQVEGIKLQEVDAGDEPLAWVVIERPGGAFLAMPSPAWSRFRDAAESGFGLTGLGYPKRWRSLGGRAELQLDDGNTIASEAPHGRYFLVHPELSNLWKENVATLGPPFSSGMLTQRQDFAGGYVEFVEGVPRMRLMSDAAADQALPAPPERRESIVKQPSGVVWWVDREDRRWAVPSKEVERCLSVEGTLLHDDVPGFAVARLERAGVADCSLAPG